MVGERLGCDLDQRQATAACLDDGIDILTSYPRDIESLTI